MPIRPIAPNDISARYEDEWRNGLAILSAPHPDEWGDILTVLRSFRFLKSELLKPGGPTDFQQSRLAFHKARLDRKGIRHAHCGGQTEFVIPTHKLDGYKNRVALEVEWNNKNPFFDRDLNNFRLLFNLRAIDAGVIITRCTELQKIFNQLGRGKSFGNSTPDMAKLSPRLNGGSGGVCPVVIFGISGACYVED